MNAHNANAAAQNEDMANSEQHKEIWRAVVGYEDYYEVSNLGRMKTLGRTIQVWSYLTHQFFERTYPEKILKLHRGNKSKGGVFCSINLPGEAKTQRSVGKMVALAFLGEPPTEKSVALHKDGNPYNLKADNLFWGESDERVAIATYTRGIK